ncbi:MAG TPA: FAD-binding oxidoreductase, partial [Casimicrobiaceae bacterium]|nr:FAD-binding oxidoreductase [Casimicrobiaceae bacterium]
MATYAEKISALTSELGAGAASMGGVGLARETSNLFRDRAERPAPRINLRHFDRVLAVDAAAGTVRAEGMTRFVDLADATLEHGTMPQVVPQLKSITLGGALAGVGIEATSFRYGLVHDSVAAFDVLTGDGRVVTCTRDNEHRDLFYGFPNAYGTLGYALGVTQRTRPVKPFVQIEHHRYRDPVGCFADVAQLAVQKDTDFLDGVVFAPGELYLTRGTF